MIPALPKPRPAAPCNGCGLCCIAERCPIALAVAGEGPGPCPLLERQGERFGCGMILDPARHAPALAEREGAEVLSAAAALLLGAGKGCDSTDEVDGFVTAAEVEALEAMRDEPMHPDRRARAILRFRPTAEDLFLRPGEALPRLARLLRHIPHGASPAAFLGPE